MQKLMHSPRSLPSRLFHRSFSYCLALGLGSSVLLSNTVAQAQVRVSPLVIQKAAERGQSNGVLTLRNGSDQSIRVRLYAEPFTYESNKGFKVLDQAEPSSLVPYLQFAPRELEIAANSERRVRFSVRFPPDLADGEYRAVLFADPLQASASGQSNIGIRTRVGATVYVKQGSGQAELSVKQAQWNAEQGTVQLEVANTGAAMARPRGTWAVSQGEQVLIEGRIRETSVLSESDRIIPLQLDQEANIPSGTYQLNGELRWGKNSQTYSVPLTIPQR